MVQLAVGKTLQSKEPTLAIDAGLDPGLHGFRLVAVRADGTSSPPVEVTVTVAKRLVLPVPPVVVPPVVPPVRLPIGSPIVSPVTPVVSPVVTAPGRPVIPNLSSTTRRRGS